MDIGEFFKTNRLISETLKNTGFRVLFSLVVLSLTIVAIIPTDPIEPISIEPLSQDPVTVFPDFTKIADIDDKKRQFLDYLEGFIVNENKKIAVLRSRLLSLNEVVKRGGSLNLMEADEIITLGEIYRVENNGMPVSYTHLTLPTNREV